MKLLGTHENIVSLYDVLDLDDETIMLTEFVAGGELFDYIVDMVEDKCDGTVLRNVCNIVTCCCDHRDLYRKRTLRTCFAVYVGRSITCTIAVFGQFSPWNVTLGCSSCSLSMLPP